MGEWKGLGVGGFDGLGMGRWEGLVVESRRGYVWMVEGASGEQVQE